MFKQILLLSIIGLVISVSSDPNTFSNYQDIQLDHLQIEWLLNLDDRLVDGTAQYNFTVKSNSLTQIHLDVFQLNIHFVYFAENGQILEHQIDVINNQSLIQGDRLTINLHKSYTKGDPINLRIKYSLDERAKALNFLTKEQTGGKRQPYVFSQCEDINCRSIIPLQDTPSVKHTYQATIITRPEITVFMSGNQTQPNNIKLIGDYDNLNEIIQGNQFRITTFESKIPFQSYLIAIIAGDVTQKQVGKRTYVISEPDYINKYAEELSDLEEHLQTLEDYIGPYLWGDYKIVIQPPSFPIGGMENPLLTFASPSIIVGDKSGVSVAIHEMAHSWTGNTVTCENWSNFWLNEGFTVFLARKALINSKQYGLEYAKIDSYDGDSALLDAIESLKSIPSYTSLFPITEGVNPGDSSSEIPYEKGSQFLSYLESFIGEADFKQMLRDYIGNFQYKSIGQDKTRDYFVKWIQDNKKSGDVVAISDRILREWDSWVKAPGYPPVKQDYKTERIVQAQQLAQSYIELNGQSPQNYKDFQNYYTNQKYIFLQYLSDNKDKLNVYIIQRIDNDLQLTFNNDKEILWRWFRSCLQAKFTENIEAIHIFLGSIGRQKMILPVYTQLNIVDHDKAVQYFQEYFNFYHPLARASIANIINSKFQIVTE